MPAVSCCAGAEPPLDAGAAARHAAVLKALADPHRLRILSLLAAQPPGAPLCVCEIEASFDLSQPTISHHLRVLREAGLVSVAKRGLWHYYALVPGSLASLQALLRELSGEGAAALPAGEPAAVGDRRLSRPRRPWPAGGPPAQARAPAGVRTRRRPTAT
jgi:ArsR family transcriptional regulator